MTINSYYPQRNKKTITNLKGTHLKNSSKITKVLALIDEKNGATKYECVTEALLKTGTKQLLRGYYSCVFKDLRVLNICDYDAKTYKYTITAYGKTLLEQAKLR